MENTLYNILQRLGFDVSAQADMSRISYKVLKSYLSIAGERPPKIKQKELYYSGKVYCYPDSFVPEMEDIIKKDINDQAIFKSQNNKCPCCDQILVNFVIKNNVAVHKACTPKPPRDPNKKYRPRINRGN